MGTHTDRGDTQEEIHAQGQCTRDILDEWKNTATGFHINSGKYIHSLSFSLSLLYSYKLPPPLTHIIVILFSLSPYSVMPNACSCTSFSTPQERNNVHSQLLELELPNLDDSGENENEKLRQVTQR